MTSLYHEPLTGKDDTMIRRDKRNIGKRVRHINPKSAWFGREGKVTGFRGDIRKGVPVVNVFFDGCWIEPIPGTNIERA